MSASPFFLFGTQDPTVIATSAAVGSWYFLVTTGAVYVKTGAGDTAWTLGAPSLSSSSAFLGSGVDGALVFDGVATVVGTGYASLSLVPAVSIYTLTRNLYATDLTVNALNGGTTVQINPNGFQIFCTGTCTVNGKIACNGGAGGQPAGTGQGAAGVAAIPVAKLYGASWPGGTGGGAGSQGNQPTAPGVGVPVLGTSINATTHGANGLQFQGGGGGTGTTAGAITANVTPDATKSPGYDTLAQAISGRDLANTVIYGGIGGGGGGGGNVGTSGGGGGGAAGGTTFVAAKAIAGTGSIEAKGGTGGAANATGGGNAGGGGGGSGGMIVLVYGTLGVGVTVDRSAGNGGAGHGGGENGGNGGPGRTYAFTI